MSRLPLTDMDAVTEVNLMNSVPESMAEPAASAIRKIFHGAQTCKGMSFVLAIWPDGTWAILGHNSDWSRPRPTQLVRAYRKAYSAGICMPAATPRSA